ncbi:MAG: ATP-binding protein [Actinomycetota bacterium]
MAIRPYRRPIFASVLKRLSQERGYIQVLAGPRQVGKTTVAYQVMEALDLPSALASADDPAGRDAEWLLGQWEQGRTRARGAGSRGALLVLDEIHKVPGWADLVKLLWDEDTASGLPLRVMLLGSAPLAVRRGLSESLTGRFELLRVPHWTMGEMRDAFGWDLDQYVFYGGYPGAARLIDDPERWRQYVQDSLIETSISRDILLLTRVNKPALLRQLFRLACDYSGQVLSYQKMLGQLQDAGNATTLANYLQLLQGAGMVAGLEKFSGSRVSQRASSPKLVVLNTGLMTARSGKTLAGARNDPEFWGRLVETSAGAHLVNGAWGTRAEVFYWREGNKEVDYVLRRDQHVTALEVTSGRRKGSLSGLGAFRRAFEPTRRLLVGGQGVPLEEFLLTEVDGMVR